MKCRLGILSTHPIQYYTPLFRYLASEAEFDLTVYYCHKPTPEQQGAGFGVPFEWDQDLVSGYSHVWLENRAKNPSVVSFDGCDTPEISGIISREKFSAFLTLGWHCKSMWQAMRACWRTKTPVWVRGDSQLKMETPPWKRAIKEITHRLFIPKFDACFAVGSRSEDFFAHYGAKNIFKSPHFVDNAWFSKEAEGARLNQDQTRAGWGIPKESRVFLFAGKFEEKKKPLDILLALKKILKTGVLRNRIHVLMVGEGPLKQDCVSYAKAQNLPVAFPGFLNQSEMPRAYAASDVLVLPSDGRETWGLVVNEAMACGLPVIVSNRAGSSEDLVRDGGNGFIFPCGDTELLAKKMLLFFNEKSIFSRMGGMSREIIGRFTAREAAEGIFEASR